MPVAGRNKKGRVDIVTENVISKSIVDYVKQRKHEISADAGSDTFGILSNPFLAKAFKTMRFEMKLTFKGKEQFSYFSNAQLKIHEAKELFHHTDENTLKKIN